MGKVQRKVNRHLYAMQGTTVGYTGVIAAYAVVLLQSKHLNATEIGIAIALCSAFGIFLQPLVAAFSNRHRNVSLKTIMAFLDLISLVGAAALYFATSPLVLVIVIFVVTSSISTSMLTFIGAYAMEFAGEFRYFQGNWLIGIRVNRVCHGTNCRSVWTKDNSASIRYYFDSCDNHDSKAHHPRAGHANASLRGYHRGQTICKSKGQRSDQRKTLHDIAVFGIVLHLL